MEGAAGDHYSRHVEVPLWVFATPNVSGFSSTFALDSTELYVSDWCIKRTIEYIGLNNIALSSFMPLPSALYRNTAHSYGHPHHLVYNRFGEFGTPTEHVDALRAGAR